jgi:pseudouridine-5'-phosphate glycosidase
MDRPLPGSFVFSDEVKQAMVQGLPVVALESTIISHGMPYPQNVTVAKEVEDILRSQGVAPATIGILEGQIHIGMTAEHLEMLGRLGESCRKVSRRDLAAVVSTKQNGATTVSATMLLAHMAGIPLFVTGGIGGVHRGATETWDVSADLTELGRTPVCVVCAGAKSILDLPLTLEFLESQGVCVAGYGTDDFPAFFTPHSGLPVSVRVDGAESAAALLGAQLRLGINSGIVLAVPVPDKLAAESASIEEATQVAIRECQECSISGNAVTPYLLKRINEITDGDSLRANIALVKHNASVGAAVAKALHTMRGSGAEPRAKL